jgi:hypothetical protein
MHKKSYYRKVHSLLKLGKFDEAFKISKIAESLFEDKVFAELSKEAKQKLNEK